MNINKRQLDNMHLVSLRLEEGATSFKHHDLTFLIGTRESKKYGTKPFLAIWRGKRKDSFYKYLLKDEDRLINEVIKRISLEDERFAEKEARKEEKKSFIPDAEVGDIFVASWGYGQTNVDAYQVIEKASKHFVKIREIGFETVPGSQGMDCDSRVPVKDCFLLNSSIDSEKKYKVSKWGIKIHSSATASKWNPETKEKFYCSWYY